MIASVLLAKDYDGIMNRLLDQEACHVLLEVICGIVRYIATFVKAQGIIMTTIAMTAAATLGIAGIKHGILWGILAGILDALPFIGTGVVLVPLGMFQILDGNWGRALVCGVLYVVCIFCGRSWSLVSSAGNRGIPHSSASVVVCGNPAVWRLGDHQGAIGICAHL